MVGNNFTLFILLFAGANWCGILNCHAGTLYRRLYCPWNVRSGPENCFFGPWNAFGRISGPWNGVPVRSALL